MGAPRPSFTHRALVWFLPRVPPHVNHQHVLSFEGLLLPRTVVPAAHELLLLPVDVVIIDVLWDTHARTNECFSGEGCPLRGSHVVLDCRDPSYQRNSQRTAAAEESVPVPLIRAA